MIFRMMSLSCSDYWRRRSRDKLCVRCRAPALRFRFGSWDRVRSERSSRRNSVCLTHSRHTSRRTHCCRRWTSIAHGSSRRNNWTTRMQWWAWTSSLPTRMKRRAVCSLRFNNRSRIPCAARAANSRRRSITSMTTGRPLKNSTLLTCWNIQSSGPPKLSARACKTSSP